MKTMTTMRHLGQAPGRARIGASVLGVHATGLSHTRHWQGQTAAPAFGECTATRVDVVMTDAYTGSNPAGTTGLATIKRPARHLGTRST